MPAQLGDDVDDWRDLLLLEMVMPHLGIGAPTILYDYPASQAALAKVRDEPIPVAERFELFYEGIELANGYHELWRPSGVGTPNRKGERAAHRTRSTLSPAESAIASGDGGRAATRDRGRPRF